VLGKVNPPPVLGTMQLPNSLAQRHADVRCHSYNYVKRDAMIPMRDGVKLHTVIVIPRGA
jgi:predicted acyl esterase